MVQPPSSAPRVPRSLLAVILVGGLLRVVPIWFGLPFDRARPDEETAIGHALAIVGGDLNPHFFHWPSLTFYLFAGAFAAVSWLQRLIGLGPALSGDAQFVIARAIVAAAGTITIVALYAAMRQITGQATAVIAAFFLAVAPLHVRDSHFAMTDVLTTLFVTLSIGQLLRAIAPPATAGDEPSAPRRFAVAGLWGGLAASTKYTGAATIAACIAALCVHLRRPPIGRGPQTASGDEPLRSRRWTTVVAGGACAAGFLAGFFAGTPYALLDPRSFASGVGFDVTHLATGHAYVDLGPGWTYHLGHSLWYGLGPTVFLAAAVGTIVLARLNGPAAVVIGTLCGTLYAAVGPGRTVFFRYVLPIVPMACGSAALAVQAAARWLTTGAPARSMKRLSPTLLGPVALAIALPPLVTDARLDLLLARTDSRVLAGRWLAAHVTADQAVYDAGGVYAGASWLDVPGHQWGAETYDAPHNVFRWSEGRLPDWLVLPESALVYGAPPPELRRLAAEKYRLAYVIAATSGTAVNSVYDRQDAFFLPIAGFDPIVRPGPTFRIYQRATDH